MRGLSRRPGRRSRVVSPGTRRGWRLRHRWVSMAPWQWQACGQGCSFPTRAVCSQCLCFSCGSGSCTQEKRCKVSPSPPLLSSWPPERSPDALPCLHLPGKPMEKELCRTTAPFLPFFSFQGTSENRGDSPAAGAQPAPSDKPSDPPSSQPPPPSAASQPQSSSAHPSSNQRAEGGDPQALPAAGGP